MHDLPTQIREPENAACLKILSGPHKGKQFRLLSPKVSIGQSSDCDIILKNNKGCSNHHASITCSDGIYHIQSMDSKNPVIVNKKPSQIHQLKTKDIISIGTLQLQFVDRAKLPKLKSSEYKKHQQEASVLKEKKSRNTIRVAFVLIISLLLGYISLNKEVKKEQAKKGLKTEQEILEEIKQIKQASDLEADEQTLSPAQKAAQVAFIKGFRDYRKGYYHRALKSFQHCTTIDKNHSLCDSYTHKSQVQIERIIQRKIVLGKSYKKNRQYEACEAAFKSIEIMIQDSSSSVYKEARENRKLCQLKIKNKI